MSTIFCKLSTAKTIAFGPVLDATGAEYTGAAVGDVKISKNNGTPAALDGSATLTHKEVGIYELALTANDISAVGMLTLTLSKTTYVAPPVRLQVVNANVYDSLFAAAGTDYLDVSAVQFAGQTITCAAGVTVLASVGTAATSTAQTGDTYALANGATGFTAIDTVVDAIKAKTDSLTFTVAGDLDANVQSWAGASVATPSVAGVPEVDLTHVGGVAASGSATVDANVTTIANGAITAAAIATGAIDADALAADAGTEIGAAVKTAIEAAGSHLTLILEDTGTTLPSTLSTILTDTDELQKAITDGGRTDLLIDAIKAKTDAMPSAATISTQVASDLAAAHGAGSWATATGFSTHSAADVVTALGTGTTLTALATAASQVTIASYIDTEVAAILAAVDTEVAAIKAKTDYLPSATAGSAGGVFIAGTNAPVTITGSGNALTLTSTGANGRAMSLTSHGSGSGLYVETDTGAGIDVYAPNGGVGINVYSTGNIGVDIYGGIDGLEIDGVTKDIDANLGGSIASVATGGISSTSFAANAINAAAIANGAIDAATFAADVDSEIAGMVLDSVTGDHMGAGTFGRAIIDILTDTSSDGVVVASTSKTGYKLASDGLDTVATTAPTGLASNFREMLVQTWRRFFKKSTLTATELKTYADDGTTVVTTQTVSDAGGTETQGDAS